jgi:MFS family permease
VQEPRGLRASFVSFKYRDYRLLFVSSLVTQLGTEFLNVSNAWQIWSLTGSALHLGLTGIARGVPVILFSLIGGVIADRVDRRKIIVYSQLATGALALLLAFLTASGVVEVWHIYAVVFLTNTLQAASNPARRAVLASVVPREHLMNAMVLQSLVMQADRIGAPALAGVLIAVFGTPLTYALNGGTYLVNAATLMFVVTNLTPTRSGSSPLRDMVEGLTFVRQHSIILVVLSMDAALMLVGNHQVLLPVLADRFGVGPVGFGLLGSATAVGSIGAATTLLSRGNFKHKGYLIAAACLAYSGFLAMLGLAPWFAVALVAVAGLGLSNSLQAQTRNVLIQLLTPDHLRGRVTSFQSILQQGGPSLGQAILGGAASVMGAGPALVAGALICGAINLGIVLVRKDLRSEDLGELEPREPIPGVPAPDEAPLQSAR